MNPVSDKQFEIATIALLATIVWARTYGDGGMTPEGAVKKAGRLLELAIDEQEALFKRVNK